MTNSATKIERLKRRVDFLAVASARRKHATPGLILQARKRGDEASPRVGFTASRKVGMAVARNRAKRRLRAAAAQLLGAHGIAGVDYVVIARDATVTRPFSQLLCDLEAAMKRLNAFQEGAR